MKPSSIHRSLRDCVSSVDETFGTFQFLTQNNGRTGGADGFDRRGHTCPEAMGPIGDRTREGIAFRTQRGTVRTEGVRIRN